MKTKIARISLQTLNFMGMRFPNSTFVSMHAINQFQFQVRMYGSFEELTNAIKSYLMADDPGKLFVKILERMTDDFDNGAISRYVFAIFCTFASSSEVNGHDPRSLNIDI